MEGIGWGGREVSWVVELWWLKERKWEGGMEEGVGFGGVGIKMESVKVIRL